MCAVGDGNRNEKCQVTLGKSLHFFLSLWCCFSLLPLVSLVQLKKPEAGARFALSAYLADKVLALLVYNSSK